MAVAASPSAMRTKKTKAVGIPTIDLSCSSRQNLSKLLVEACEEYGFFKLINHGVPEEAISRLDDQGVAFFAKPDGEKQAAGPPTPFGYGFKNIGQNGDMGELEYLLLHANPTSVSELSKTISNSPSKFSCAVNDYVEVVRSLACDILDLLAEGLWISDKSIFSRLINDVQSDSVFRINHYPPLRKTFKDWPDPPLKLENGNNRIGFGEHSDPQILTILRSNDVGGLQISLHDELWIPVSPDPSAFYIMVGDVFQALTNGRFRSIKHRVLANREAKARIATMYFGAPPLNAWISPLPETVMPHQHSLYRPFTWAEYKSATYSLRLSDSRLDLFKIKPSDA